MSWLKDILEENRRVVDSWPAWKKGAWMMTRDEFEEVLTQARQFGGSGLDPFFESFLAHDQAQRGVIAEQQQRIDELIARKNYFHRDVVEWRGVEFENVCTECSGSGYKVYGNTTTYHHGAGGQAITTSVCNKCWGSGDKLKPWTSWLKIEQQAKEIARLKGELDHWSYIRFNQLEQENKTLREALQACKRELWHCNKQLVTNGWKEGGSVTQALELAQQALKES